MRVFGAPWDAPAYDDGEQVPTPVGEPCEQCRELIEQGDRGVVIPGAKVIDAAGPGRLEVRAGREPTAGRWVTVLLPFHLECHLRLSLGSLAHLEGRCSCTGAEEPAVDMTAREEARAVQRHVEQVLRGGRPL